MELLEIIKKRHSCRDYLDKPVEPEKLDIIFEAARQAPSAKNLQDWRFVVVTDKGKKLRVAQCTNRPEVFSKAAVIIAACSNNDEIMRCGQPVGPIDIAIALEHIALQATALDLATCWIGSFETRTVRRILDIPNNIQIIELMAIGYPASGTRRSSRLPLEDIVCYEKWQF
jgi:nitroreductase